MRLTHLGSSSPVSVHFVFVRVQSSSFMGRGHVLGAHHSCVGVVIVRVVVCGHGCCPWGCVVVCGLQVVVCGWGSFAGSAHRSLLGG